MSLRAEFLQFDDALAAHGVPPLTEWWREGIGEWLDAYEQVNIVELALALAVLEFWACVGRGAAKSTALYKLATFFMLFGAFDVPPGERHFAIVLSRLKEEASKGIAIVAQWLTLLGIAHRPAGDVIELADMPRGIRVVAASVAAASGWRAFFIGCDEHSKWASSGLDELNASEVRSSAIAMTATHPLAPVVTVGSAWGAFGEFYEAIDEGTTDARFVVGPTPTWIAAPHISKESTQRKERNPLRWRREYACEFTGNISQLWTPEQIDGLMEARDDARELEQVSYEVLITDPSNLKKDKWTAAAGGWWQYKNDIRDMWLREPYYEPRAPGGRGMRTLRDKWGQTIPNPEWKASEPFFLLRYIMTFDGSFGRTGASIVGELADFARHVGINRVISDQRDAMLLESEFARHRMQFKSLNYTNPSKAEALLWIHERMRTNSLRIEQHETMRQELLEFREKILPSGTVTYEGLRHDDHVSLLLTGALGDIHGCFRGSPTQIPITTDQKGYGDFARGNI